MRLPLEKDVQAQCLDLLALAGVFAIRVNSGAMKGTSAKGKKWFLRFTSQPGTSDILGVLPDGAFLACEVKREPGDEPTEAQASFLAEVKRRNGVAVCVGSVDELRAALRAEGYEVP